MRTLLPRLCACALLASSLACARGPGSPRQALPEPPGTAPEYALDLPIADAPADPAIAEQAAPGTEPPAPELARPRPTGLEPIFALGGGLVDVRDWASEPEPAGYGAQLVPADTNLAAQHDAELWAPDAKQMYVAVGFWRTPLLGLTKHVFYSPTRDQKYILYFKLFKGIVKRKIVKASEHYKVAYDIMRGAQDVWSFDFRAALERARMGRYKPTGSITVGVLIHPLVLGPTWVFLDNPEDQRPVLAVHATDGIMYTEGNLQFDAIKVLVQRSEDEDLFGPVSASSVSSSR